MDWNELFEYKDNDIYWKASNSSRIRVGDRAGFYQNTGYRYVRVNGKATAVHRVIYEMHFGAIPKGTSIDHINQVKDDNRLENLRLASKSLNEANTGKRSTNTSGYKGVYFAKQFNKWRAKIDFNKKEYHIGYFVDIHEAAEAYNRKAVELFGEFACLNEVPQQ